MIRLYHFHGLLTVYFLYEEVMSVRLNATESVSLDQFSSRLLVVRVQSICH